MFDLKKQLAMMAGLSVGVLFFFSLKSCITFVVFGILIDIDHIVCQPERTKAFLSLVVRGRWRDPDQAWVDAKGDFPTRVNYFHTWVFALALALETAIFPKLFWVGLVAYAIHILSDVKIGYGEKNNIWELPGIIYRWIMKIIRRT